MIRNQVCVSCTAMVLMKVRGGSRNFHKRGPFYLEKKSDFKTICFKKNQKLQRHNSKRKLQNMEV